MRRTTILLEDQMYDSVAERARRRGTSVSEEIRRMIGAATVDDPNPAQWLLDLAEAFADVDWKPGPPIDSDEFKAEMAREIYRDSFNREPDW